MLRYDRNNLYTRASNLFLFLESLFLFLAHRTHNSVIASLFGREDDESARMPQGPIWIECRRLGARRDWRTNERIRDWSWYWWECISRWVNMRSNFWIMQRSVGYIHLAQINEFSDGSVIWRRDEGRKARTQEEWFKDSEWSVATAGYSNSKLSSKHSLFLRSVT